MNPNTTFRTKASFCHVEKDYLLLTKDDIIQNSNKKDDNNRIVRILMIYSVLSIYLL
ncbi:hypothetical protein FIA58_005680 [Flavobacterium jejuense]|uniref:Uncharacterized protein n=1 Tax=Flavobacterium jejuense TaxID=1544455 RepID=A0ABX0ISS6_9FLAO|nr:hypothetical protein [Flavobacterium jejuense]NHN25166.1 hypothetical protein [Flavobacterium jejuense]